MIKILLTSDLHLGLDWTNGNSAVSDSSRIKTLRKLVYLAKSHDLFLIAGDFFHHTGLSDEMINIVRSEFYDLRESGVDIIIAAGEQEVDKERYGSVLSDINASKVFFDSERLIPYKYFKDDQEIFVYGLPANSKFSISDIKKISDNGFHIGLFHADFNFREDKKKSEVIGFGKKDIISSSLDFYALGHHHQFQLFKSNVHYIGAYPGSPEATNLDEKGDRYALSIIVKDDEIFQIKRLTVNTSCIEHLTFDCSNADQESLMSALKERQSEDKILKLIFTGKRNFRLDIDEILELKNNFQNIYILDESVPGISVFIDEFSEEETLRGEFFKILDEKLKSNGFADLDADVLSDIIGKVIYSRAYTLEDICSYWNV